MRGIRRQTLALAAFGAVLGLFHPVAAQTFPSPPTLPAPAPGGPEHIFYGAVPPSPPYVASPWVLVFFHGLHGVASNWWVSNDMYDRAYKRGYRTAFVSMNLDNTPNDAGFEENAPVARDALARIALHYNTDKVVIIGHSKGGIDAQAAMLDPSTRALVRAVFTISTPNSGTELADWAFGPGKEIAGPLGLLTPGVQSLMTDNMEAFRKKADPVLRASGIPFYTMGGTDARGNLITEVTGIILYDRTKGQKNDGFVPFPRTKLPQDYANDLGEVKTNHFAVDSGWASFPKINGRLQILEYTLKQFDRIASGGHGDPHNNWMWSLEWFKGKLYVGTGREIQCLSLLTSDTQVGTNVYPFAVLAGECPEGGELARSLAAEIWSYCPRTREWRRVFKSPEDLPLSTDEGFIHTARDVGFRGMTVFREADGTEALYVGGVTSGSVYEGLSDYAGGFPPPRLLRSVDGVHFEAVPQDPGTFLGEIGNPLPGSTRALRSFRALTPYKGKLFATIGDFRGLGVVVASSDPAVGNDAWELVSPITEDFPVWNLAVYNGFLYATTGDKDYSDTGFGVYKTDATGPPPYRWSPVITNGAYQPNPHLRAPNGLSFAQLHGQLYVGTNRPTELYRINPDDTWDLIVGEPRDTPFGRVRPLSGMGIGFGSWFNGHFWRMAGHQGSLYLTTWDASTGLRYFRTLDTIFGFQFGFDFFRSQDGVHWEAITRGGMWDSGNIGGRSILSTEAGLFLGTARNRDGAQVFQCRPPNCTPLEPQLHLDRACVADEVREARAGPSRRTVRNRDTPSSLRCEQRDEAADEILIDRPRVLEAESEEVSGREVILRWLPVSGAVQYRIYRSTVQGITTYLAGLTIEVPGIGEVTIADILNGALDHLCTPSTPQICTIIEGVKNPLVGLPGPFVQVGIRTANFFSETAPTAYQSIYFVRAEDSEGNLSTASNFVGAPSKGAPWAPDATPPVIVPVLDPPPNAAGWNRHNVTLSWQVEDPETGISRTNFCDPLTITSETAGRTFTCSAVNGKGMAASAEVTVHLDKTPPIIRAVRSPQPNESGWSRGPVSVVFSCHDALSGVAACAPTHLTIQASGRGQYAQATARDVAGNAALFGAGPISIDGTPPEARQMFDVSGHGLAVRGADDLSRADVLRVSSTPTNGTELPERPPRGTPGNRPPPPYEGQRRFHLIGDEAGNTTEVEQLVRQEGGGLRARITGLRYGSGQMSRVPHNLTTLQWSVDGEGRLRRLEQTVVLDAGDSSSVHAVYSGYTDATSVEYSGRSPHRETYRGLALLRLETVRGSLRLDLVSGSGGALTRAAPEAPGAKNERTPEIRERREKQRPEREREGPGEGEGSPRGGPRRGGGRR
jgi:hypothetical protein